MDVGLLAIFQNFRGLDDDANVLRTEMELALAAEELGFDTFWPAEHHFTDYSACPDNIQFLSWVAGKTERIKLATGAVIVPWNDPLRVAEKMIFLDHLSGGRAALGLGRGLARKEYDAFGLNMDESRDRFDEGARMIIEALETGWIEGDGPYYPQKRVELRPRPLAGFRDRFYAVGMSPDSVEQAARLGARLMIFSQQPWEAFAEGALASYRATWRDTHTSEPSPPVTGDLMFCHEDPETARKVATEYMSNYFLSIVDHYELMSDHFKTARGYDYYATTGEMFAEIGLDAIVEAYLRVQTWGTPSQIITHMESRRELLGDFELNAIANYGGIPRDLMRGSVELFAKKVLPVLKSW
ncbi:MAG: alkanesulfonate monooxygenase SsuD [Candidatus Binatia bacterium]|jgi:alkanesulfonate monooxygenase SsuD/methylene tetrahydromethanopterin reductase-like flavin-dependent oxidoreductase (luciferase family)